MLICLSIPRQAMQWGVRYFLCRSSTSAALHTILQITPCKKPAMLHCFLPLFSMVLSILSGSLQLRVCSIVQC